MRTRGFTQNEEYIEMALNQGREFMIPCKDEKDANSKRVSLYNVKRTLSLEQQKKLSIQKTMFNGEYAIKVSKSSSEVWELIDGKYVKLEETSTDISELNKQLIQEMLNLSVDTNDIVDAIMARGELEDKVLNAIAELTKGREIK
jgi:hypothetical protein